MYIRKGILNLLLILYTISLSPYKVVEISMCKITVYSFRKGLGGTIHHDRSTKSLYFSANNRSQLEVAEGLLISK